MPMVDVIIYRTITLLTIGIPTFHSIAPNSALDIRKYSITLYAASTESFGHELKIKADEHYHQLVLPANGDIYGCHPTSPIATHHGRSIASFYLLSARGNCSFEDKAIAAQAIGARGLVIYNTVEGIYQSQKYANAVNYDCNNGVGYVPYSNIIYPIYSNEMEDHMPTSCTQSKHCVSKRCVFTNITDSAFGVKVCCAWDLYISMAGSSSSSSSSLSSMTAIDTLTAATVTSVTTATTPITIPVVFIRMSDADILFQYPTELSSNLLDVALYSLPTNNYVNISSLFIILIAVMTVLFAAAVVTKADLYSFYIHDKYTSDGNHHHHHHDKYSDSNSNSDSHSNNNHINSNNSLSDNKYSHNHHHHTTTTTTGTRIFTDNHKQTNASTATVTSYGSNSNERGFRVLNASSTNKYAANDDEEEEEEEEDQSNITVVTSDTVNLNHAIKRYDNSRNRSNNNSKSKSSSSNTDNDTNDSCNTLNNCCMYSNSNRMTTDAADYERNDNNDDDDEYEVSNFYNTTTTTNNNNNNNIPSFSSSSSSSSSHDTLNITATHVLLFILMNSIMMIALYTLQLAEYFVTAVYLCLSAWALHRVCIAPVVRAIIHCCFSCCCCGCNHEEEVEELRTFLRNSRNKNKNYNSSSSSSSSTSHNKHKNDHNNKNKNNNNRNNRNINNHNNNNNTDHKHNHNNNHNHSNNNSNNHNTTPSNNKNNYHNKTRNLMSVYPILLSTIITLSCSILWFIFKSSPTLQYNYIYLWVSVQNLWGISVCIVFLSTICIPNLRIATILLVVGFIYDVFFVFYSSSFFGLNLMSAVVNGLNMDSTTMDNGLNMDYMDENYCEKYPLHPECDQTPSLPMLLLLPTVNLYFFPLSLTSSSSSSSSFDSGMISYTLVGLGDVILPGLLLIYCARLDLRRSGVVQFPLSLMLPHHHHYTKRWSWLYSFYDILQDNNNHSLTSSSSSSSSSSFYRSKCDTGYFSMAWLLYVCGLCMANYATYVFQTGQPALLYIVPLLLLPVLWRSWSSGLLPLLWCTLPEMKAVATPITSDEEESLLLGSATSVGRARATWIHSTRQQQESQHLLYQCNYDNDNDDDDEEEEEEARVVLAEVTALLPHQNSNNNNNNKNNKNSKENNNNNNNNNNENTLSTFSCIVKDEVKNDDDDDDDDDKRKSYDLL